LSNPGDPERLGPDHILQGFDSGEPSLDIWLIRHARAASAAGSAQTFVVVGRREQRVVGYYALTVASIEHADATLRARKGMPSHSIPAVLLARLAVDRSAQGQGLGAWLLQDAMRRSLAAAENMGIRVLLVHALHAAARNFYERFGFEPSHTDPLNLQLLIKDIRKSFDAARS
jgi:GNAT superfamily N-acetyltransferase